jgi:hypothetical protein
LNTEADTCRTLVLPKLYDAGWQDDQLAEQRTYTAGRIIPRGQSGFRKKPKWVDYLLRFTRDFFLAVVEAKQEYKQATDGLQQAKEYAQDLGLKFAYSTNGHSVVEFDFLTGVETELKGSPSPTDLWNRLRAAGKISDADARTLLTGKTVVVAFQICWSGGSQAGARDLTLTLSAGRRGERIGACLKLGKPGRADMGSGYRCNPIRMWRTHAHLTTTA